ncbi:MAG: hypothetical protein ACSHWQ_00120 [Spongiibacteraceae bacterium]
MNYLALVFIALISGPVSTLFAQMTLPIGLPSMPSSAAMPSMEASATPSANDQLMTLQAAEAKMMKAFETLEGLEEKKSALKGLEKHEKSAD